jgi:hypothetical protein
LLLQLEGAVTFFGDSALKKIEMSINGNVIENILWKM